MAELLKQRHGLLALKVGFASGPDGIHVEFTIERHREGMMLSQLSADQPVASTSIPNELGNGPTPPFSLPDRLIALLATGLADSDPAEPLWLHLVKPYGHLGALPWEGLLTAATGRPVLRLPDFLERPREDGVALAVAIVCDIDLKDRKNAEAFRAVQAAWLSVPDRDIRIDVFPSRQARAAAARCRIDPRVILHHPLSAMRNQDRLEDPWMHWITHDMAGRALDAVHILCRGDVSQGRSSIVLSRPYQRRKIEPITFVSPAQVSSALGQAGAWCTVAAGPADGSCDTALRHFVDAIAQARPGPALFHRLGPGPIARELKPAFKTLFTDRHKKAPTFQDAFLYCQPELLDRGAADLLSPGLIALDRNEALIAALQPQGGQQPEDPTVQVPNWVAAAQRFVEGVALDTSRNASGDVLMRDLLQPAPPPTGASAEGEEAPDTLRVVQETVNDLQKLVEEYALQHSAGDGTQTS